MERTLQSIRQLALAGLLSTIACLAFPSHAPADAEFTGRQFLDLCDTIKSTHQWNPRCHAELLAGLKAAEELRLACPDEVDRDQIGLGYVVMMHQVLKAHPELGNQNESKLRLATYQSFWPCPK